MHIASRNAGSSRNFSSCRKRFGTLTPRTKADKTPTFFSAALAHEIRNPLTNIELAVDMLLSTDLQSDQKFYLDVIKRASFRINGLVTELVTSGESGEAASDYQSIHLVLNEVLALTNDRIRLKNIEVLKNYTEADCNIWMNKQQLKIAIVSIVINAIEAMPAEAGKLTFVTRSGNGQFVIEIEDNGTGISEQNLSNIFKPFYTSKPGGLGLGLSTTLDILKANHAMVEVKSELDRGTTFLLSFARL